MPGESKIWEPGQKDYLKTRLRDYIHAQASKKPHAALRTFWATVFEHWRTTWPVKDPSPLSDVLPMEDYDLDGGKKPPPAPPTPWEKTQMVVPPKSL